jgi:hypothetical protein
MLVKELIHELSSMNPDAEVHFSYNYNDYWRTQVAPKVSSIETSYVTHSKYHNLPKLIELDDEDDEDDEDTDEKEVVIIR